MYIGFYHHDEPIHFVVTNDDQAISNLLQFHFRFADWTTETRLSDTSPENEADEWIYKKSFQKEKLVFLVKE